MDSPQDYSNISSFSFHLSQKPPELVKANWPGDLPSKNQKPLVESSIMQENEAVSKGVGSPRRKKYSVSKRKSKKQTVTVESIDKSNYQSYDVIKKVLSKLTSKTKSSLAALTKNIKRKRFVTDFHNLSAYHYEMIKDPCALTPATMKNRKRANFFKLCKAEKFLNFITRLPLMMNVIGYLNVFVNKTALLLRNSAYYIDPNSSFKVLWDLCLTCLTIIQLFTFSIEKCFLIDFEKNTFEALLLLTYYLDLIIKLNTKFFREGVLVTNRIKIIKHLFTKKGFSDLFPCLCLSLIIFLKSDPFDYLNLVLYAKILKAKKLSQRVKDIIIRTRNADAIYQMMILIINIFSWAHVIAVLWHFVGLKSNPNSNWLKTRGIEKMDWQTKYLFSIYWGVTTMLTVGYGDISPANNNEMIYNIIAMFIGCGIFGYSMNKIGEILSQYHNKKNYLNEQMSKVSFLLRDKKLPLDTQTKIKRYLEFVWKQEQKEDPEHEQFVMNKLSSELRSDIYLHTNVKYLKKVPAFRTFSEKTLILLARFMKKVCFSPEEHVYKEGEFESQNIFFVLDGNLKLVSAREDKLIAVWKKFKRGDFFGEREVFSGLSRGLGIISTDFSTLFKLSRSDVIQVLKKFPLEYEKFCEIKDLEILYDQHQQYESPCFSCGFKDHPPERCDFLKFNPNNRMIIYKYLSKERYKAKHFKRKTQYSRSALKGKISNTVAHLEFLSVYQDDEELRDLIDLYSLDEDYRLTLANSEEKDKLEALDSPRSKREGLIREKSRELTLSRWRRKSVRAITKSAFEKNNQDDNNYIKRTQEEFPSFVDKDLYDVSHNSSANEIRDESDEEIGKIKQDKQKSGDKNSKQNSAQKKGMTSLDLVKEEIGERKKTRIIPQEHSKYSVASVKESGPTMNFQIHSLNNMDSVRVYYHYFPQNNVTEIIRKQKWQSHKILFKSKEASKR